MVVLGKEEFEEDFHLSKPKMLDLNKYYHQYPGRETCLCRYHMEFDNHFYALRKYKSSVRRLLPEATHSALPQMPDSPRELRKHLQCEREGEYYVCGLQWEVTHACFEGRDGGSTDDQISTLVQDTLHNKRRARDYKFRFLACRVTNRRLLDVV